MTVQTITYSASVETTPEAEASALAHIYRYIIDCRAMKKEAAPESRPEDERKDQHALTHPDCT